MTNSVKYNNRKKKFTAFLKTMFIKSLRSALITRVFSQAQNHCKLYNCQSNMLIHHLQYQSLVYNNSKI